MIKGVNMQVLEIKETGNKYFDRVILFVDPKYYNADKNKLTSQAYNFTKRLSAPPKNKRKKNWKKLLIKFSITVAVTLAIVTIVVHF